MSSALPHVAAAEPGMDRLTVLQSSDAPSRTTNPYLVQLMQSLAPFAEVRHFSMARALFSRYDVFHVHWPEYLARHRGPLRNALKQLAFGLLLLRLWATRTPVVRTLHNLQPHESRDRAERALLPMLDRLTTLWIRINATTAERPPATTTILHGHYRDWFAGRPSGEPRPGRILHFGLLRPYKGVENLLAVVGGIDDPGLGLRIVGKPAEPSLAQEIERACTADPRISASLRYVDDDQLSREIGEAELVVLPYRYMHNSGTLLLALSLQRPVLVPLNEANEAIAREVGPGWVFMYSGELDADTLVDTMCRVAGPRALAPPDLSAREWRDAGPLHVLAYQSALQARSRA